MQVRVLFSSGFCSWVPSGHRWAGSRGWVRGGRVAEEFAGGGVDDAGLKILDEQDDAVSGVGLSHADVVESAAVAQGEASRVLCRPYASCGSRLRAA